MKTSEDCDDCISRQAVLEEINRVGAKGFKTYNDYSQLFDFVDTLPPVIPQPNNGYDIRMKWCPNCGVKIQGVQK